MLSLFKRQFMQKVSMQSRLTYQSINYLSTAVTKLGEENGRCHSQWWHNFNLIDNIITAYGDSQVKYIIKEQNAIADSLEKQGIQEAMPFVIGFSYTVLLLLWSQFLFEHQVFGECGASRRLMAMLLASLVFRELFCDVR